MADTYIGNASLNDYYTYDGPVASQGNLISLSIFLVLSILALILPLRSFWLHKNIAAINICLITDFLCLQAFVNGIIWPSDDWEHWWLGYGLCDIEAFLRFPVTIAFALALCRMIMRLSYALDVSRVQMNPSRTMLRRKMWIDLIFIWGLPTLQIALHYLVQIGRYGITPIFGCVDQLDSNFFTVILIYMWGPIITALTVYYAGVLYYRCHKHRHDVSTALSTSGSGLSEDHFWKLILISSAIFFIYIPCQLSFTIRALPHTLEKYSWSNIHNPTWGSVMLFHTADAPVIQYNGWAYVGVAALMFIFFGFNDKAINTYRFLLVKIGFGKIFPSLTTPRRRRSTEDAHWADFVAKFMRYSKKQREARERKNSARSNNSHQDSLATTALSTIPSHDPKLNSHTSTTNSEADLLSRTSSATSHHGFFSLFRTTLSSPFSHSSHRQKTAASTHPHNHSINTMTTISTLSCQDLEAQVPGSSHHDFVNRANPKTTFQTKVWSSPSMGNSKERGRMVEKENGGIQVEVDIEELVDPLSPKIGSQAYRERERREMEREKLEAEKEEN